jgi:hypothetical protein
LNTAASRFSAAAIPLLASLALAQPRDWRVTILHPDGFTLSVAWTDRDGQQAGTVSSGPFGRPTHASLWSGSADSWLDLHPPGALSSVIFGTEAGVQVGSVQTISGPQHAALWNSTPAWTDLNPPGASSSHVNSISLGRQLGYAQFGSAWHAVLWNSSPSSFTDLHPATATASFGYAIHASRQAGSAVINGALHACTWSSSAHSWTDLHPTGALNSEAYGINNTQQVGWADFGDDTHAGLWNSSASSWIDLHPPGHGWSEAYCSHAGLQVGVVAREGDLPRATLWSGTAASLEDLSLALPGAWNSSAALSIWSDATTLYISGFGDNAQSGRREALLWTTPLTPPCPADFNGDTLLDFFDYLDFAQAFAAEDPTADFDHNGQIDFFDYLDFATAYESGCD